jgi:hypothetical protein
MVTLQQNCDDHPFDTSAVGVQELGGGLLAWNIHNWEQRSFPWIQIVYVGSDGSLKSSGRVEFLDGGATQDFTSMCNGESSSIEVYLAVEPTMPENTDVCTGWDPESNICRYKVEVSCGCEEFPTISPTSAPTSSPAPTVCKEIDLQHEDNLIDWPLVAGPEIVARDNNTGTVTIAFNQTFNTSGSDACANGQIDWVAFVDESNTQCNMEEEICYGSAVESTVQCDPGQEYTTLTVFVSSNDESFSKSNQTNPANCAKWTNDDFNVAKYVFEVPCKTDPCQVEPSAPTAGPTSGPTSAPTVEEPICIDERLVEIRGQAGLGSQTCNGTVLDFNETTVPVEVIDRSPDGENVTFRINQLFYNDTIAKLSVLHRYNSTSQECEAESEVEYGWNETYTAHCFEDEAQITIYMYLCDIDELTECENCARPDNFTNFLEYSFSVSCLPECVHCEETPEVTCPDDVDLVESIGVTQYDEAPIRVLEQNETTVTFTIDNFLNFELDDMFIQYHYTNVGDTKCENHKGVSVCGTNTTYTAHCMSRTPVTIVDLWISDSHLNISDSGTVPRCCHPDDNKHDPVVQYSFLIHCVTQCPDVPAVRLLTDEERSGAIEGFYKSSHQGQMSSPLQITAKGGHYCSKEDHPCGANNENVHVCHYSARDGYQTFCVPEDDTDILAYYPKDHCGPCFGGFANPAV